MIPVSLIILLVFIRFNLNYLLFHSLAEYFAIFVSLGIALITYYTYEFTKNRYLLFIGLGYFWISILDTLHTQTYLGMSLYNIDHPNTSTTFWVFSRLLEASILLLAPFMRRREFKIYLITFIFAIITSIIIVIAMFFPLNLIVTGEGLTTLKINLEFLIIAILLVALYINKKYINEFTHTIKKAITWSILFTILAEISFTLYNDVYGVMNVIGHSFKFVSFWILLQAIIKTSLEEPFRVMQQGSTTYNAIPLPSIVVDKYGIIRQVNKAACDLIDKDISVIVGSRNHQLYHPANLNEEDCPVCQAISKGDTLDGFELTDKDSNTVKQYSLSPIKSQEDNVQGMVQVSVDITKRRKIEIELEVQKEVLRYQSHYDKLTNLPNRVLLLDRLIHAINKPKHYDSKFALLVIDLDQFKQINETLGHPIGDKVLKIFNETLRECIHEEDTLSRSEGNEFTILLEDIQSIEIVSMFAQKIMDETGRSLYIDGNTVHISVSIGISLYSADSTDPYDLLKYADSAMYKVKAEGGNNFKFYSFELTQIAMNKITMQNDLRESLKNEDFEVYYQPQIKVSNTKEKLVGVEALVRWNHPKLGIVSPIDFIPLAEETGMIIELDRQVMKMAIAQVEQWYKEGLNPGILSLNLAMKQLQKDDFIDVVKKIIVNCGCKNQDHIAFEITESDLMRDPESSIEKLNALKKLGIEIAIDDFGTGYSSLSYLKRLPVSKLKIDQSFTKGLPDDKDDVAIVKAIISLAENLNMSIIAEGVETKEQKEFMVLNGCNEIQGYFYSKPLSSDDMKKFMLVFQ